MPVEAQIFIYLFQIKFCLFQGLHVFILDKSDIIFLYEFHFYVFLEIIFS